ncbi:MAG TPA: hypothetical protein VHE80_09530 [Acidimicrobiales bacterium]|nr:hypothetical protein [Acidimicrobiales bacterium]
MSTIENTCGCGCSTMTVVTNASEACSCGCECCAQTTKSKDEEIAELQALRESVDKRLAELS